MIVVWIILIFLYVSGLLSAFWFGLFEGSRRYKAKYKIVSYAILVSLSSWIYVYWYYRRYDIMEILD
jgi:hypothetical protein